jgi:hypothetical protein
LFIVPSLYYFTYKKHDEKMKKEKALKEAEEMAQLTQ